MSRKKKPTAEAASIESGATATAVAEPPATPQPPSSRPAYIDGPPVNEAGQIEQPAKNWSDPYKAIVTGPGFEMGENRRFKQRVFSFKEKPSDEVIAALKDNGFTYRASEKAWTIHADADTRKLSDELAKLFRGPG